MTLIGKILTIIVFVMSLLFLGFAVTINRLNKDPVTKKSWYEVAEQRKRETQNAFQDVSSRAEEITSLQTKLTTSIQQLEQQKVQFEQALAQEKKRAEDAEQLASEASSKFEDAQSEATSLESELSARTEEALRLNNDLKDKDLVIANLQTDITQANNDRIQAQVALKSVNDRMQALAQEHEKLIRSIETGQVARGTPSQRPEVDDRSSNPPPDDVRGVITGLNSEGTLLQISIGSDDGVDIGQTLEIFRLRPRPEYLGMMKIIAAKSDHAVGKLLGPNKRNIRVNDSVASRVLSRK